jgi:hypothetical protein
MNDEFRCFRLQYAVIDQLSMLGRYLLTSKDKLLQRQAVYHLFSSFFSRLSLPLALLSKRTTLPAVYFICCATSLLLSINTIYNLTALHSTNDNLVSKFKCVSLYVYNVFTADNATKVTCTSDSDCTQAQTCIGSICINPCTKNCGKAAICQAKEHNAKCSCPTGYEGNALIECFPAITTTITPQTNPSITELPLQTVTPTSKPYNQTSTTRERGINLDTVKSTTPVAAYESKENKTQLEKPVTQITSTVSTTPETLGPTTTQRIVKETPTVRETETTKNISFESTTPEYFTATSGTSTEAGETTTAGKVETTKSEMTERVSSTTEMGIKSSVSPHHTEVTSVRTESTPTVAGTEITKNISFESTTPGYFTTISVTGTETGKTTSVGGVEITKPEITETVSITTEMGIKSSVSLQYTEETRTESTTGKEFEKKFTTPSYSEFTRTTFELSSVETEHTTLETPKTTGAFTISTKEMVTSQYATQKEATTERAPSTTSKSVSSEKYETTEYFTPSEVPHTTRETVAVPQTTISNIETTESESTESLGPITTSRFPEELTSTVESKTSGFEISSTEGIEQTFTTETFSPTSRSSTLSSVSPEKSETTKYLTSSKLPHTEVYTTLTEGKMTTGYTRKEGSTTENVPSGISTASSISSQKTETTEYLIPSKLPYTEGYTIFTEGKATTGYTREGETTIENIPSGTSTETSITSEKSETTEYFTSSKLPHTVKEMSTTRLSTTESYTKKIETESTETLGSTTPLSTFSEKPETSVSELSSTEATEPTLTVGQLSTQFFSSSSEKIETTESFTRTKLPYITKEMSVSPPVTKGSTEKIETESTGTSGSMSTTSRVPAEITTLEYNRETPITETKTPKSEISSTKETLTTTFTTVSPTFLTTSNANESELTSVDRGPKITEYTTTSKYTKETENITQGNTLPTIPYTPSGETLASTPHIGQISSEMPEKISTTTYLTETVPFEKTTETSTLFETRIPSGTGETKTVATTSYPATKLTTSGYEEQTTFISSTVKEKGVVTTTPGESSISTTQQPDIFTSPNILSTGGYETTKIITISTTPHVKEVKSTTSEDAKTEETTMAMISTGAGANKTTPESSFTFTTTKPLISTGGPSESTEKIYTTIGTYTESTSKYPQHTETPMSFMTLGSSVTTQAVDNITTTGTTSSQMVEMTTAHSHTSETYVSETETAKTLSTLKEPTSTTVTEIPFTTEPVIKEGTTLPPATVTVFGKNESVSLTNLTTESNYCTYPSNCSYNTTCVKNACVDPCLHYDPCVANVNCEVIAHEPQCLCPLNQTIKEKIGCKIVPGKQNQYYRLCDCKSFLGSTRISQTHDITTS